MPFAIDSAAVIRDRALETWRSRYLLLGRDLDIRPGSHAYNEMDALSYEIAATGLGAQEAAQRVLLRYAQGEDLDLFAEDDGTARLSASTGRFTVTVTGPTSASTPVGGAVLSAAGGARYRPVTGVGADLTAIDTDVDGVVSITVEAEGSGTAPNLASGTVLTWSSAPTGFAATATVSALVRLGEDAETDTVLRTRLLERLRERPASGNRADWRETARVVSGVGDVFVHCCARVLPDTTVATGQLGCVLLYPVNPAPGADTYEQNADGSAGVGLSPAYSRVPSQDLCDLVEGYIDGTLDRDGNAVAESAQVQRYPAVIDRANWDVHIVEDQIVNVVVSVKLEPDVWVFTNTLTVQVGSTTTSLNLDNAFGLVTGTAIAVQLPAGQIAGNYFLTKVVPGGSGNTVNVSPPLPINPVPGALVRHDPGVWSAVRAGVLGYFHALGPGTTTGRSQRFPSTSWGASDRVSPAQILARVIAVPGIVDAVIVSPSSTGTATLGSLAVPGSISVQRLT